MPDPAALPLNEWESFYVIVGSSAAALTGLMFVVIALGAERNIGQSDAIKAFATPTIVHFCSVLLLAAFITTPHQSVVSLVICLVVTGIIGLAYTTTVVIHTTRQKAYEPVLEDWIFHAVLPMLSYALLFTAGVIATHTPDVGLYFVGATALLLLFTGIHNAWDAAVYMASRDAIAAAEARPTTSTDSASSDEAAPSSETYR